MADQHGAMTTARVAVALALCAAVPARAPAHGVEYVHEVEQRDGRVAVRFRSAHGGAPLAGAWVQVFAPGDRRTPREEGRTDAGGLFEFSPGAAGAWRVRALDATGHGAVAEVQVPARAALPPAAPSAVPPQPSAVPAAPSAVPAAPSAVPPVQPAVPAGPAGGAAPDGGPRAAAPRLRVAAAAAAIVLVFAGLAAFHRRRPRA